MTNNFNLSVILIIFTILGFTACSSSDDDEKNSNLNSYESALVGSYISDDDEYEFFYLTLKSDRTGSFEMKYEGKTQDKYNIIWNATRTSLTETNQSNGKTYTHEYVLNGKHLIIGDVSYQKR